MDRTCSPSEMTLRILPVFLLVTSSTGSLNSASAASMPNWKRATAFARILSASTSSPSHSGISEHSIDSSNTLSRNSCVRASDSSTVSLSGMSGNNDCARGYISSSSAGTGPHGDATTGVYPAHLALANSSA